MISITSNPDLTHSIEYGTLLSLHTMQEGSSQCDTVHLPHAEALEIEGNRCQMPALWVLSLHCKSCSTQNALNACEECRMGYLMDISDSLPIKDFWCDDCNGYYVNVSFNPLTN